MEYTAKFHTEDVRLTKSFLRRYHSHLIDDEDVFASCIAKLWEKRPEYNPEKGSYSNYAFHWLMHSVRDFNQAKYGQKRMATTVSLQKEIDDRIFLEDIIAAPEPCEQTTFLHEVVERILAKHEKMRPVVQHFMQGRKHHEIAKITGLNVTKVAFYIRELKRLCKAEANYLLSDEGENNERKTKKTNQVRRRNTRKRSD